MVFFWFTILLCPFFSNPDSLDTISDKLADHTTEFCPFATYIAIVLVEHVQSLKI